MFKPRLALVLPLYPARILISNIDSGFIWQHLASLSPQQAGKTHAPRPIDQLIHDYKVPRPNLLLQTPYSTKAHHTPNPEFPQGRHIRPERNLVGSILVMNTMPGEKGNGDWLRFLI